jgi:hypothetical protein
MIAEGEA